MNTRGFLSFDPIQGVPMVMSPDEILSSEGKLSAFRIPRPLSLLTTEFGFSDLRSQCPTFSVSVHQFTRLTERGRKLEPNISSSSNPAPGVEEGEFETLRSGIADLKRSAMALRKQVESLDSRLEENCETLNAGFAKLKSETRTTKTSGTGSEERFEDLSENVQELRDSSGFAAPAREGEFATPGRKSLFMVVVPENSFGGFVEYLSRFRLKKDNLSNVTVT
jgi:hypothetical protein